MNQTASVRIDNILSKNVKLGEETDKDALYQHYCTYYMMKQ